MLNLVLLDNYFADLFTEVRIRYGKGSKFGQGRFFKRQSKFQPKYGYFLELEVLAKTQMQKKVLQTIMGIMFWDFLILYKIFFSPQVKWSMIISNKHNMCQLPYEFQDNLRLTFPPGIFAAGGTSGQKKKKKKDLGPKEIRKD